MFRVSVVEVTEEGKNREFDVVMSTTKVQELLGRYVMRYGIPVSFDVHSDLYAIEFIGER